jgi:hypothetical protein
MSTISITIDGVVVPLTTLPAETLGLSMHTRTVEDFTEVLTALGKLPGGGEYKADGAGATTWVRRLWNEGEFEVSVFHPNGFIPDLEPGREHPNLTEARDIIAGIEVIR